MIVLSETDRKKYTTLQFFRGCLAFIATIFLVQAIDLGLNTSLLTLALLSGGYIAGKNLFSSSSFTKLTIFHLFCFLLLYLSLGVANFLILSIFSSAQTDFLIQRLGDELFILALFYLTGLISTWLFWTKPAAVGTEGFLTSATIIYILSGHRNYRLDAPKQISSLTWKIDLLQKYSVAPQHLIIGIGIIFALILTAYFISATNRPIFGKGEEIKSHGKQQKIITYLLPVFFIANLFYFGWHLNSTYSADLGRASNGVSTESNLKEGESNLGFNSAVTATKQPAAIVRFEGDYKNNPWAPMLYFREGALSEYTGRELGKAKESLDSDIPQVGLGQPYIAAQTELAEKRESVVQSIYLITNHDAPFAIDTPKKIRPIANPKPEKFKLAYQALSHAPAISIKELAQMPLGDPSWDNTTWDHYLRAPGSKSKLETPTIREDQSTAEIKDEFGEDLRYKALSLQLTSDLDDPFLKAVKIIQYLSQASIYTRSPGHQVTTSGDPVSPYLFAEKKRGYCVHFAHAAVYLMRLAGIPSRIATGYQTDLSYAKDGHILLMLGDRHAWPEIYIQNFGWFAIDVTPAQAENEPQLIPDESLLEQFMSELDAAPEFAEPIPEEEESDPRKNKLLAAIFSDKTVLALLLLAMLAIASIKILFKYGYLIATNNEQKVRLAHYALQLRMNELGITRENGETSREFQKRLEKDFRIKVQGIYSFFEIVKYARISSLNKQDILSATRSALKSTDESTSFFFRWASVFNIAPIFKTNILKPLKILFQSKNSEGK
jgi:Transglutaminase-like superfamily